MSAKTESLASTMKVGGALPDWALGVLGLDQMPREGEAITIGKDNFVLSGGILRNKALLADADRQVQNTFGYKWKRRDTFEFSCGSGREPCMAGRPLWRHVGCRMDHQRAAPAGRARRWLRRSVFSRRAFQAGVGPHTVFWRRHFRSRGRCA